MVTSVSVAEISILRYIPEIVAWLFGIALAVIMVRRGGGKAEKLLLAGCSLMFVVRLASPLLNEFVVQSLIWESGMSYVERAERMSLVVGIPTSILVLAGLVCLAWGFWVRFWRRKVLA